MTDRGSASLPIVIDAMGGDAAPDSIIEGALQAHARGVPVVLVGDRDVLRGRVPPDIAVVHAADVVGMDETPIHALRSRPSASIAVAAELLADGRACALVSCGNTGATVLASVRALGLEDGVERVALAVAVPVDRGSEVLVLDVGASVEARPAHLLGFARMGRAVVQQQGVARPRLALLSNGEEASKGTLLVRETLKLAAESELSLVPMEPGPALSGQADVLVTDGFTGNILLKSLEAAAAATLRMVGGSEDTAPAALSWRQRSGARLLGVPRPVFVGHGRADATATASLIVGAWTRLQAATEDRA